MRDFEGMEFMGRKIIDAREIQENKELIKPIFYLFKNEYVTLKRRRKGIMSNKDFNRAVSKGKAFKELTERENEVIEAFFDVVMYELATSGNSIIAFKRLKYLFT